MSQKVRTELRENVAEIATSSRQSQNVMLKVPVTFFVPVPAGPGSEAGCSVRVKVPTALVALNDVMVMVPLPCVLVAVHAAVEAPAALKYCSSALFAPLGMV